ncbi:hypothetical protein ABUU53_26880 [Escherichia coli]|uniref:hypothetical protein n=1 Tax=Escherichia coli TaxID=562 RepID=UPI00334F1A60
MSVKITGLDKMQKQLKEVERATEALNGSYDVHFDANDPVSIENAIQEAYSMVYCVFRSIRSRIGIEVRSAIRIHSINRELNFFYRFLTRFFAAFHYRGIFPQ